MKYLKIPLLIITVLYIVSPIDIVPDAIPVGGWLDDLFLVGLVIYYLWQGKLPDFLSWKRSSTRRHQQTRSEGERSSEKQRRGAGHEYKTGSHPQDPYEILGIKPGASREEIQAAYRRAAQAYHPDKVSHLGQELQELAHEKFTQIQEAYEKLVGRDG